MVSNLGRALEVFIPAIALGELFFGAAKSGVPPRTQPRLTDLRPAGQWSRAISRLPESMGV